MGITRRVFTNGILGLGAGLGIGLSTRALAEPPTGARLAEALNGRLGTNPYRARFDVPSFAVTRGTVTRMVAHVRLDWAPGLRTCQIESHGPDEGAAWAALIENAVGEFAPAVPGFATASATA